MKAVGSLPGGLPRKAPAAQRQEPAAAPAGAAARARSTPPPRGATRGSTGGGKGKPLDVNKTQLLLEAACVAYAESAVPGSVSTGSGDAVDSWGSLDDLGLEQDAFIHDPATDTTVLVASESAAEARRRGRRWYRYP